MKKMTPKYRISAPRLASRTMPTLSVVVLTLLFSPTRSTEAQRRVPTITPAAPTLTITSTSAAFEFTQIGGGLIRRNGDLVVSHSSTNQLIVFDRSGRKQRVIGGTGTGPGEFTRLGMIGEIGDTLWAIDHTGFTKFVLFDNELRFIQAVTTTSLPRVGPTTINVRGMLSNGLLSGYGVAQDPLPAQTARRIPIWVVRRNGTAASQVGQTQLSSVRATFQIGRVTFPLPASFADGFLLGQCPLSDCIVLLERPIPVSAAPSTYSVVSLRPGGDTLWKRAISYTPQRAPADVAEGMRAVITARFSKAVADSVAASLPRFLPPVVGMLVGAGGTVWIGERTGESDRVDWLMLDERGMERVRVRLASGSKPLAARDNELWVVTPDKDDVPVLSRYTLQIPSSG